MALSRADAGTIIHGILYRYGKPLALFSAVFSGALIISRILVLPMLTAVEVQGEMRDIPSLQSQAEVLRGEVTALEGRRNEDVLPLSGTPYRSLVDAKIGEIHPMDFLRSVRATAHAATPDHGGAIVITSMTYGDGEAAISGDVSGVGLSSMTVLAQFLEALRTDERVVRVTPPAFTRLQDPRIGPHSPFTITLHFR
ncbi:hypothetical protein FJZ27_01750 [Candidatus Peribacteria bacterium]|nr:hypothetical protein [Candidatus Peribacteria bacterium]